MADALQNIAKLYAAVLDRASDPAGTDFYHNQLTEEGASVTEITEDIVSGSEANETLPDPQGSPRDFVFEFYDQAFHREPRQDAVEFWSDHLEEGGPVWEMIAAAEGDDAALMRNKAAAGEEFTNMVVNKGLAYNEELARSILDEVTPYMSKDEARMIGINAAGEITPVHGADIA